MIRRLILISLVIAFGFAIGYLVAMLNGPPLGCGSAKERILTEDLVAEQMYYFRSSGRVPVRGVIRRGSVFEVRGVIGGGAYVSFQTILPVEYIQKKSTPHEPTQSTAVDEKRP